MTNQEFSNNFTILLNSYSTQAAFGDTNSKQEITLNEYEKSIFLTQAQFDLATSYYQGVLTGEKAGSSFESSEAMRRALESLIKNKTYDSTTEQVSPAGRLVSSSQCYTLPDDLAFITLEQITLDEPDECYDGKTLVVVPIKQDEYMRVKDNPFRGPNLNRAMRLEVGERIVEIISKYDFKDYKIRYIARPTPIILEDLPNGLTIDGVSTETACTLDSTIHKDILNRAVLMALRAKTLTQTSK